MSVTITEIINVDACAYCGNKIKWYQRKGFDKRFHFSCEFILANNRRNPSEYADKRFAKVENSEQDKEVQHG